jgi:hypothetical protein
MVICRFATTHQRSTEALGDRLLAFCWKIGPLRTPEIMRSNEKQFPERKIVDLAPGNCSPAGREFPIENFWMEHINVAMSLCEHLTDAWNPISTNQTRGNTQDH